MKWNYGFSREYSASYSSPKYNLKNKNIIGLMQLGYIFLNLKVNENRAHFKQPPIYFQELRVFENQIMDSYQQSFTIITFLIITL